MRILRTLDVLLGLLTAYIGARLLAPFPLPAQWAGAGALVALFLLLPRSWWVRNERRLWKVMLPWVATGFFSWLLVLTLARDFLLLGASPFLDAATHAAWARLSSLAVIGLAPAITAVGFFMARRVAAVRQVEVRVEGLPEGLHGFTIAQITDIHVGPTIKGDFVQRIVERVNGLEADMVAITGDLVDGSVRELAVHTAPLADLRSRHGTYVVTGNHEYYSGAPAWIAELRRLGTRVLLNEHVVLEHGGAQLAVAGVTDYSAHHFDPGQRSDAHRALSGAPVDSIKLLLAHQPRSAPQAQAAGAHLQISGHTHGGQFWPWNLFVRLQQPFTAGLHKLGRMWIYISSGTGYWGPPMRFGIPSEITRIRLVRGQASPTS
jgi:predicted MPP superfamily phosphohydrolase